MNSNELKRRISCPTATGDLRMTRIMGVKKDLLPEILKIQKEHPKSYFEEAYIIALRNQNKVALENATSEIPSIVEKALIEVKDFMFTVHEITNAINDGKDLSKYVKQVKALSLKYYKKLAIYCGIYFEKTNVTSELNFSKFLHHILVFKIKFSKYGKKLTHELREMEPEKYLEYYNLFNLELLEQNRFIDDFWDNLNAFKNDEIIIFMLMYDIRAFRTVANVYSNQKWGD